MSEMVIRAAKAIRSVLAENGIDANNGFGLFISEQCARAAISAIMEPTLGMVDASQDRPALIDERAESIAIYRAMLTAALQEAA